jgi:Protein of unknown function (DUF1588)/Protein of unknown function (DUF1592)/Protein of unknown function (DUF1585)/Protein of unknown function (DUF1587)/Protein of unknown function (DUF1595)
LARLGAIRLRLRRREGTLWQDMWRFRGACLAWWVAGVSLTLSCQSTAPAGIDPVQPTPALPPDLAAVEPVVPVMPPGNSAMDCSKVVPGAAESRLLTRLQYDNTVRDLLGELNVPERTFPEENLLLGFGNNADAHRASLLLSESHLAAAEDLAAAAVARGVDQLLPCTAGDRSEACVSSFITQFGYMAFRRPIREDESAPLIELWRTANGTWGFEKSLELLLETFLQSPQLLYRTESLETVSSQAASSQAEPEGPPATRGAMLGKALELDAYQIASRLSYLLWNTLPDAELFALADSGALLDEATVREQAARMIDDERARITVADFYQQWLGMSAFAGLTRDPPAELAGASASAFNVSWQESLSRFVQESFWDGGTVETLLSSKKVYLDSTLAGVYGFDAAGPGFTAVEDEHRAGILTQPGLMALLAHADQSAPVQRGKFVREQLLCKPLPPPPPDVDTTPPDPDPSATTRERFRQHSADQRCATCHRLLEGVGFGLEEYDQLGRFRTEEYGLRVDASGQLLDSGDAAMDGAFNGAQELAAKLAGSTQVEACLATQWFRYGMGRGEQMEDVCSLNQIKSDFASAGGDFRELLVSMATSDAFRFRALGEQDL